MLSIFLLLSAHVTLCMSLLQVIITSNISQIGSAVQAEESSQENSPALLIQLRKHDYQIVF